VFEANWNNSRANANTNIGFRPALWHCPKPGSHGIRDSASQKGSTVPGHAPKYKQARLGQVANSRTSGAPPFMPTTYSDLFPRIYEFENLYEAYRLARRGKRAKHDAIRFRANLEGNLIELQNQLIWKTYRTGAYRKFTIFEPKEREIASLPFRDRVLQHALVRVIEPIWQCRFIDDSYACRPGKGTHAGADQAERFLRIVQRNSGQAYALKADVAQYFASIDHQVLIGLLRKRIGCSLTLDLLREIIDSNGQRVGLPIGNLTSQLFANIYLHELDQFVKQGLRERYYLRYMDDFCVIGPDRGKLHEIRRQAEEFLSVSLKLRLNRKTQVFPVRASRGRALDFLGYRIWPTHRKLRKASERRMRRALKKFVALNQRGSIDLQRVRASVASWVGHAHHADTYRLRARLFDEASFSSGVRP
jgi:RNA-directed DNA polymerase